jgi:hypothetical protein
MRKEPEQRRKKEMATVSIWLKTRGMGNSPGSPLISEISEGDGQGGRARPAGYRVRAFVGPDELPDTENG